MTAKKKHNPDQNADTEDANELVLDGGKIKIKKARIPSPFDDVLIEYGKDLVKGSIDQALEFNKTMLGLTATFATLMASTFGILAFGIKDQQLDLLARILLVIPVFLMLASSVSFSLGYYPRQVSVKLRTLDSIRETRDRLLRIRKKWGTVGILLFVLSIASLLGGIISANLY